MEKYLKIPLFLTVLVPFIIDSNMLYPDVYGKVFWFSLLILITGILFSIEFLTNIEFRKKTCSKIDTYVKNLLFLSILGFIVLSLISAIFSFDTYLAFWGNVERGEGFFGLLYLFSLLSFSVIIFEKKDWIDFFKLVLISSTFILLKEFGQFLDGISRPSSFIGNPIFLAGYLLFPVLSSFIVFKNSNNKLWKYFSVLVALLAITGIFLTETRGTMLGVFVGIFSILIYFSVAGKDVFLRGINLRKLSLILILITVLLSFVFIKTKDKQFWQDVPGLSRISQIDGTNETTVSRIIVWKSSLQSINPKDGIKNFLIGWGPENSVFALGKYYNPEVYKYDNGHFDRSHNKFLDVLVMNGVFGLIFYILIWFFLFRFIIKESNFSLEKAGLLFFSASFLVHLMFVFDQIPTSIFLFYFFAYVVFINPRNNINNYKKEKESVVVTWLFIITFVLLFVFIKNIFLPFIQMKKYSNLMDSKNLVLITEKIDSVFTPFTIAQLDIRRSLIDSAGEAFVSTKKGTPEEKYINSLFDLSIEKGEDYIKVRPDDFVFPGYVAQAYTTRDSSHENSDLIRSEEILRQMLKFSPQRQDFNYNLAINLAYQERYEEAIVRIKETIDLDEAAVEPYYYYAIIMSLKGTNDYKELLINFEKAFDKRSDLFLKNYKTNIDIYVELMQKFYHLKDKENFIIVTGRLKENQYPGANLIDQILEYVEKGTWPIVEFK